MKRIKSGKVAGPDDTCGGNDVLTRLFYAILENEKSL